MGIFGKGEGYSREGYDEAAKLEKDTTEQMQKRHAELAGEAEAGTREYLGVHTLPMMEKHRKAAHDRVQELYKQGHKEAHELNEQYDRLWKKAQSALDALEDFEMSKLGMLSTGSRIVEKRKWDRDIGDFVSDKHEVKSRGRKVEKTNPENT